MWRIGLWIGLVCFPALGIEFKADHYVRDFNTQIVRGQGNAWARLGDRQVWADSIEIDMRVKIAVANGNVRIKEGRLNLWATHASYSFEKDNFTLENGTLVAGTTVMTGAVVQRIGPGRYRIEEGSYSNCNVDRIAHKDVGQCQKDWKVYAKRLDITIEQYAHFYDALAYVKGIPILYTPYFLVPVKTQRQSGLLWPFFLNSAPLGSGVTLPLFLALDYWHDLTINPTLYSKTGYHIGLDYRYAYSPGTHGFLQFNVLERRFSPDINAPEPDDTTRSRTLGLIGEWSVRMQNQVDLPGRSQTRQSLMLVSNPFYTRDYETDLGHVVHLGYLRSFASYSLPGDYRLLTARVRHHQSLIVSRDEGADAGAVTELPTITWGQRTTPILGNLLSVEWHTEFSQFSRFQAFDQIPTNPSLTGENIDPDRTFDANDVLRTGRRLRLEPRLVANIPMPPGFQFQPSIGAGSTLYQFDYPTAQLVHWGYLETELPVSFQVSRTFNTGIDGYERINHVFQPRFTYGVRPLQSRIGNHPFFCQDPETGLYDSTLCPDSTKGRSNPRFDLQDRFSRFEYMRLELINRFRRNTTRGIERFFLLQVSTQYNLRTFAGDFRYSRRLAPLDILSQLQLWRLSFYLQARYDFETTTGPGGNKVHENVWSAALQYDARDGSFIAINTRLNTEADPKDSEEYLNIGFRKVLPTFVNLAGNLEYNMRTGELLGYSATFIFRSKPRSCWTLELTTGRTFNKLPFTNLNFQLDLGGSSNVL